jgi:hypothetical protein
MEDLHMPLHVGENHDKGGNQTQVQFFGEGTNLHRLWDSGLIEHGGATEDFWIAELGAVDTPAARAAAVQGTTEDWATESLLAARLAYQVPETGKRMKSGQKLADAYLKANLPRIRSRLYLGGVRLAWVLNDAFRETPPLAPATHTNPPGNQ